MVEYRNPYPSFTERIYWTYRKHIKRDRIPPKSWVQLSCPNSDDVVIATEHTDPIDIDHDVTGGDALCTYDCEECGNKHRWLWGPPAPIRVNDAE